MRERRSLSSLATVLVLSVLAFGLTPASRGYAATLTVCASGCGFTTIAAAIGVASAGDTINVLDMLPTVHSESSIDVSKSLTIQGQGATKTVVDGGASGSVFTVEGGVTATIQGMTIRNGAGGEGGGILNLGTLTVRNSTLSGNATSSNGGGISNHGGTLTISNSTLSGNTAPSHGGGIFNDFGTLTVSNSTLSGNSAGSLGGGIFNFFGTTTISNSTLSGNSAFDGGGIFNVGPATISSSTLSGNSATFGGGIFNDFGTTTVKNSIVGNGSGSGNCLNFSTITALGANLDTDASCGSTNFTAVTLAKLNLGPLALNAPGTTKTLALLPGSVAINAAADCTDVSGNPVSTDQRGVSRPDSGETACDIGAFELVDQTPFASFTGKLEVTVSTGGFGLTSNFTLGAGTSGINPVTQAVTLQIGPYSVTIPAGSFKKNKKGAYVFEGVIGGVSLELRINPVGGNSYTLQADGDGANLGGIGNPVTVMVTIGNDTGSTNIAAELN